MRVLGFYLLLGMVTTLQAGESFLITLRLGALDSGLEVSVVIEKLATGASDPGALKPRFKLIGVQEAASTAACPDVRPVDGWTRTDVQSDSIQPLLEFLSELVSSPDGPPSNGRVELRADDFVLSAPVYQPERSRLIELLGAVSPKRWFDQARAVTVRCERQSWTIDRSAFAAYQRRRSARTP